MQIISENGGLQGSKQVFVAGDDRDARESVTMMVRAAGFTPVDTGLLVTARTIEDIPVSVFTQWRVPFYIHLAIFIFLYILSVAKFQVNHPVILGKNMYVKGINEHDYLLSNIYHRRLKQII